MGTKAVMELALAILLVGSPVFAWQGKRDNKSVAELQLMNEQELTHEAVEVCLTGGNTAEPKIREDALDYLGTIGRVARQRAKTAEIPQWARDIYKAVAENQAIACIRYSDPDWLRQKR